MWRPTRAGIGWSLFAAIDAVALAVALLAPASPSQPDLSEADARIMYASIAREEPALRAAAARSFPGDLWSQDDDFHGNEQKKIRALAGERQARIGDALRAVDDGMREGWSPRGALSPKVPPCRPRLDY